jgi:xanthine dehydrogenase YagS FAD-binding subunit
VNPFSYTRAASVSEAIVAAGRASGAHYIAGGTNILDLMKDGTEMPPLLVDINALPLRSIVVTGDVVRIGALARMADVAADPQIRSALPMLVLALEASASPQLRNMASMGGNVLQRTRCPYFRDVATPCNKRDPGSGCSAIGGVNREQAVFGTSDHCIATHASDAAVALTALEATLQVAGASGMREIAFGEFYRLPASTPHVENTLEANEVITGIAIPLQPALRSSTYVKVRDRAQFDFALAAAAVALGVDGGIVHDARIALGGVATIPWRSLAAERALVGQPSTRASFEAAADAALAGARGYGENDFKIPLARATLIEALTTATEAA